MTFVPFQSADSIGDRFLALLSRHDIHPPTGWCLENELLSLTQLIEVMKNPDLIEGEHQMKLLREAAGLHDFAAKVLSVEGFPEFAECLPHLRLIAQGKIASASIGQNKPGAHDDETARKMAELYMGCLAMHVGTEVHLDSPTAATGDNPDVIFTVAPTELDAPNADLPPETWTLAIKTISTNQGQTIFERIKDGARQIDAPKCSAQKGMVVINAKNALDHQALANATFSTLGDALNALSGQLQRLADEANAERLQSEWDALFSKKVKRPVLFLGQSLVFLRTPASDRTPTAVKVLRAYDANGEPDETASGLAWFLNECMQNILLGIPGTAEHPPR